MLISQHKPEISNGISIRPRKLDNHLGAEQLLYLANAIYIHAYKLKYDVGRASKEIVKEVNALRSYQASMPVSKFFQFLKLKFKQLIHRLCSDVSELCFFWMNFPECFPVNIDKAFSYVTAETYIQERLPNKPLNYPSCPLIDEINVDVDLDAEIIDELNVEKVTNAIDTLFAVAPNEPSISTQRNNVTGDLCLNNNDDKVVDDLQIPPFPLSNYPSFEGVMLGEYASVDNCVQSTIELLEHQVPGDGNCQFTSLIVAAGLELTVGQLRRQLRKFYDEHFSDDDQSVIDIVHLTDDDTPVTAEKWGNDKTLRLFTLCYGLNICLHHHNSQGGLDYYSFHYSKFNNTIHLRLRNNHYTPLLPKFSGGYFSSAISTTKTILNDVSKALFVGTTTAAIINVVDSKGNLLKRIPADIEDKVQLPLTKFSSPTEATFHSELRTKLVRSYLFQNTSDTLSKVY